MYRIHVLVSWRAQKVWFRKQTQTKALEIGLTGWVKNLLNQGVKILAEGNMDKLIEFTEWLQDGPPLAKVNKLNIEWFEMENEFNTFEIH